MTPWGTLFLPRVSQLPRISSLSLLDSFSIFSPACDTRHVFYEGRTRLLCRTRRLRMRRALTSANQHIQLPPQPTCSTDSTLSSTFTDNAWEWATGSVFPSSRDANKLYLSLSSVKFFWRRVVWVCEGEFVRAGSSLASNSAALVVSFPGPPCSQADKLCHAFICHTGCYLSLPFTLASWYALSPAPGILPCHWRRKRGISLLLPWRSCRMPELLLQVNWRLKCAEMKRTSQG